MRFLDKGWKKIVEVIIKLFPQKYTNVGLNLLGIRVGNNSIISKTTYFQTNCVEIGSNVYINKFCEFLYRNRTRRSYYNMVILSYWNGQSTG